MRKRLGIFGLLAAAIVWGLGYVASEVGLETLTPIQILMLRFMIAAFVLCMMTIPKLKHISKQTIYAGVILGGVLYLAFLLQTVGLKYTTPSKNAFLTATNVVMVPFLAFVIHRKSVDIYSSIGAVFALTGIGFLSLNERFFLCFGDGLTLLCALCFAVHIFLTAHFVKRHDFMVLSSLQMLVAFLLSVLVWFLDGKSTVIVTTSGMWSVIYLGVCSTALGFFLQTVSQKYTTETKAAVILSMESVFGTLFSMLLLHEKVTVRMLIGSILILTGVLISETKPMIGKRRKQ